MPSSMCISSLSCSLLVGQWEKWCWVEQWYSLPLTKCLQAMFLASLPTYRAKDEGTRWGFCKQIFDTHGEAVGRAAWTLETVKIAMHNLDQREKKQGR